MLHKLFIYSIIIASLSLVSGTCFADVTITATSKKGHKVKILMDYATYGSGDLFQGIVLDIESKDKKSSQIILGQPKELNQIPLDATIDKRVADFFALKGKEHLILVIHAHWNGGKDRIVMRWLGTRDAKGKLKAQLTQLTLTDSAQNLNEHPFQIDSISGHPSDER